MTKHLWSILCRKTLIEGSTNVVSILEVLEEITFNIPKNAQEDFKIKLKESKGATLACNFEVVTTWENLDKQTSDSWMVEMENPDGIITKLGEGEIALNGKTERSRVTLQSSAIGTTAEGRHEIRVYLVQKKKKSIVATLPLHIKFNQE